MDATAAFALPTMPGPSTQGGDWASQTPDWADFEREATRTLPEGLRLQDYELVGPIGEGGFGVVYLAWDPVQERHVAIKEYLPAVLASRDKASSAVLVRSPQHQDSFRIGLRSFVNEARILARFDHPALVRVLHYWEGNGTAYMAMPYYQGPTLARALAELGRPPEEEELRGWLGPLLDALGTLHAVRCLHRDIAPDNILLTESGPVLLDFGAARRVIDGAGQSPTVVFKPGFTPLEQYGELASMRQGPWTDLYALAAVVYAAITGQPPVSSVERMPDDPLRPLSTLVRGRYSDAFLAAIDAALAVHPQDRPQSAAELWDRLGREVGVETPAVETAAPTAPAQPGPAQAVAVQAPPNEGRKGFVASMPSPARVDLFTAVAPRPRPVPAPVRRNRTMLWALSGAVVLAGLAAAGYYRIGDPVQTVPPLAVQATMTPPPTASPAAKATPMAPAPVARTAPIAPAPIARTEPVTSPAPAIETPMPAPLAKAVPPAPAPVAKAVPVAPPPVVSAAPAVQAPAAKLEAIARPATPPAKLEAIPPRPATPPETAWAPPSVPAAKPAPRTAAEPVRTARREARPPAVDEAPAPQARRVQAEAAPAPAPAPGTCSDLLQRASLGPLAAGEVALLRKGCE